VRTIPCIAVLTALMVAAAQAKETDASSLEGYWAHVSAEAPASKALTLARAGSRWRASYGGEVVEIEAQGNDLRFDLPGGRGGFRGGLVQGERAIEGFWLQPARAHDPSRPLASPLTLARAGRNLWRAEVQPLDDPWHLYLRIHRDPENGLLGAFRNPERNDVGGASRFRVIRNGAEVDFSVSYEGGELRREGELIAPDRLRVNLTSEPLELTRVAPEAIPRAFPRGFAPERYRYRAPDETGDGWRTARGREVGLDEEALRRAMQRIIDGDPFGREPSLIHSVLVARQGRLVLEEYFFGHDRDKVHDIRSAGKTYASVLLGAAMRQGASIDPQSRITELLSTRGPFANRDPRKDKITLAQLMTHTSGLDCDDNNEASHANEDTVSSQRGEPDWWRYTLNARMAHDPGVRYAYCSASINLVGGAITDVTGIRLPELFDQLIARPLQFARYFWMVTPNGDGYLGGGAYIRPRDLLKLGQVYLDGGSWRGRRIVERAWVTQSTAPHAQITPETTGLDQDTFSNTYGEGGADGYAWHVWSVVANGREHRGYAATGNGGQLLVVLPDLDMTFVFTGGNYRQGGVWTRWPQEIIGDEIIAAMSAD
jgi:CubicO group peptidase (beta-lactamase class C family)